MENIKSLLTNLKNKPIKIKPSYNIEYYASITKHVFVVEVHGEKIECDNNVLVLCFDGGDVIKLCEDSREFKRDYRSFYRRCVDITSFGYIIDDKTVDMLKSQKLVSARIEFDDSCHKGVELIKEFRDIHKFIIDSYDKFEEFIKNKLNDKVN